MGLKVGNGQGNVKFYGINMKEGCFAEGSGADKVKYEPGRAALTGIPYRMAVTTDTFEDQKSLKANLYMHDPEGGPNMCVSWTIFTEAHGPSSQGLALLGRVFAADTTKPVQLRPWKAEAGEKIGQITFEKDTASVSLKQQDAAGAWQGVKPDFAGRGDKLPDTIEKKIEGVAKPVLVKPGWEAIMEDVMAQLVSRLDAENPRQGQQQAAAPAAADDIDPTDLAAAASNQEGMRARA